MLRPDNAKYDGQFEIPTLAEINRASEAPFGRRPRRRHLSRKPSIRATSPASATRWKRNLVRELKAAGWGQRRSPRLHPVVRGRQSEGAAPEMTKIRLIQLMDKKRRPGRRCDAQLCSDDDARGGSRRWPRYAYGVGPNKDMVDPAFVARRMRRGCASIPGRSGRKTSSCPHPTGRASIRAGMAVFPTKFGPISRWVSTAFFTDFTAIGVEARAASQSDR